MTPTLFDGCYSFLEEGIFKKYGRNADVVPEITKRAELLEILMVSFLQHCMDVDSLSAIADEVDTFRSLTRGPGFQ